MDVKYKKSEPKNTLEKVKTTFDPFFGGLMGGGESGNTCLL